MPQASAAPAAKRVRTRTFATLAENPAYRRFYLGQGVSLIGTWLQDAAVAWIVFDMTGSERVSGIVSAAGVLPGVFVGLFAGALADRIAPRRMILMMQAAQMGLAFALAGLVASGSTSIWPLAVILAVTRICVTFEMPSRQVFLYHLVGRSSLMNAIALNSGLFNASRVLGPALAGICLDHFGHTSPFLINGASYLAAIGALLTITPVARDVRPNDQGSEVFRGLAYLKHDARVRTLFLLMGFFSVVGMGYMALAPAYASKVLHARTFGYSMLLCCGGAGATIGALVVASLGGMSHRERLVPAGMVLFGGSLAVAGWLPPLLVRHGLPTVGLMAASGCLLAAGFGALVFYAATQTLIQTSVPDDLRGRIMGVWMIVYSASVPLGSLWAGLLGQGGGVALVMEVSAALCVATAVFVVASGLLCLPSQRDVA
jgi:MFS family permease